jgi:hypothetical protein
MERKLSTLVEFLNMDVGTGLERWKNNPESIEEMAKLNELFRLTEKIKLDITLEVHKEAIDRMPGDYFVRILNSEKKIYGKELENSWVFEFPAKLKYQSHDPIVLNATDISGEPHLVCYHLNHGQIASFRPSDIMAITIK